MSAAANGDSTGSILFASTIYPEDTLGARCFLPATALRPKKDVSAHGRSYALLWCCFGSGALPTT
jgi:hypothetical protein